MGRVRVGISGWRYAPWRGNFYPEGLAQHRELEYASGRFNTLEINGTFYSLQRPESFRKWYEATPRDFVFAIKGPRFLTHMLKLSRLEGPLANFWASGVLNLAEKTGPFLWQFSAMMRCDIARFERFFAFLPKTMEAAAALARQHEERLEGRAATEALCSGRLRHAVEFRHESFLCSEFVDLCRAYNVSIVVADVASRFPTTEDVTADFVYVRLHGSRVLYQSGYTPREIEHWARRIEAWRDGREPEDARRAGSPAKERARGRDVYVYFDNTDVKLRAPVDAARMAKRLGIGPADSRTRVTAGREEASPWRSAPRAAAPARARRDSRSRSPR
jgi:uncharacterized protein YecE (DUF72 family)